MPIKVNNAFLDGRARRDYDFAAMGKPGRIPSFLKDNFALILILAVAAALRTITLGSKGLWLDEAYSVHLAGQRLGGLISQLSLESTPPLYYLSLHFWMNIFGTGEAAVRALSLVFSLGTIAVLYALGRKFFGRAAGVAAAVLAAVAPLQVYYAQETRMYSLLALLAAGLLYFTVSIAGAPSEKTEGMPAALKRSAIGMGVAGLLLLYTHTVALWFVAGCFVAALYFSRDKKARMPVLLSAAGMAIAYLPWALVLIKQVARQSTVLQWFVPFWNSKPVWRHAVDSLSGFSFGPFPPYLAIRDGAGFAVIGLVLALAVLAWGLVARWKLMAARACALVGLLAFGFPLVYSRLFQPVYIPGRTDQYLQPVFLLLVGAGIAAVSGRKVIQAAVVVLFAALSVYVLIPWYGNAAKDASRDTMEEVRAAAAPGDVLVATGYTVASSEYYASRWKLPVEVVTFPLALASHPGFFNSEDEASRPDALARDADSLARKLADIAAAGKKGIILLTPHGINDTLLRALSDKLMLGDLPGRLNRHESLVGTPVRILIAQKAEIRYMSCMSPIYFRRKVTCIVMLF